MNFGASMTSWVSCLRNKCCYRCNHSAVSNRLIIITNINSLWNSCPLFVQYKPIQFMQQSSELFSLYFYCPWFVFHVGPPLTPLINRKSVLDSKYTKESRFLKEGRNKYLIALKITLFGVYISFRKLTLPYSSHTEHIISCSFYSFTGSLSHILHTPLCLYLLIHHVNCTIWEKHINIQKVVL